MTVLACGACTSGPPTGVVILVESDLPRTQPWQVTAAVRDGVQFIPPETPPDHRWRVDDVDAGAPSFGVVPSRRQRNDASTSLLVSLSSGGLTLRRNLTFQFTPGETGRIRVFLPASCARRANPDECSRVGGPTICSQQELCELSGRTCGDLGDCVAIASVPTPLLRDAAADARDASDTGDTSDVRDSGIDATIDSGVMVRCGGRGESCCAGAVSCIANAVCVNGTCAACGGATERCCNGDLCQAGTCRSGTCVVDCGATGQPCCAGSMCVAGTLCSANRCVACGRSGQPCCAGASPCESGTLCNGAGTCEPCGARNQRCCVGRTCASGTLCMDEMGGSFCRCGQRNTVCCSGTTCDPGIFCAMTGFGPICVCGGRDQPCCNGTTCDPGINCLGTGFGPLCLCGTENRPCCPGNRCDGTLRCNATGFGPICQR